MSKSTLIVAVSGGVDSVVLLDMLARAGNFELVVAHFNHGIRTDSAADARFVKALAEKYDKEFVSKRGALGANASEEQARKARYDFLFAEAAGRGAVIVTAHHLDDVIETIAINTIRGTGWRGLAVLERLGVVRPLLERTKDEIYDYALAHRLEWVEDSTNASSKYLRNRVRRRTRSFLIAKKLQLQQLRNKQCELKKQIDQEIARVLPSPVYSRYFFTTIEPLVAYELLRAAVVQKTGTGPTRPQLGRALLAIKTAKPGAAHDLGGGMRLVFTLRTFVVETL